jgi:peroxiredoxin
MKKILYIISFMLLSFGLKAQSGLKAGQEAPQFSGTDIYGKQIDLKTLLKKNKYVVLFFYRGQWCPYCNKQIQQLQDSLRLLTGKGAFVLGVSPETNENIRKTIDKTHASFSLMHDGGYKIMKAYDVNYIVDPSMLTKYKNYGVDLEQNNGNTDHVLPVPATYIIDQTGRIVYVHFDKDYRRRPAVSTLLTYLK